MQARMDTQQQRLDSLEGLLDVMAVGNPTLQRALAERRAALGMSQPDPGENVYRPNPQPTTPMAMMLAFSFLFNFFCFV
ncbi:hypothetical protein Bca4012_092473 [Brassica carinata]